MPVWLLLAILSLFRVNAAAVEAVAGMDDQAAAGGKCIALWRGAANHSGTADRLAVVYLHAHVEPSVRDSLLACSINSILKNIGHITPLDVFVFVMDAAYDHLSARLSKQLGSNMARVCLMRIPKKQWQHSPRKTQYQQAVNVNRYGDYLVMGLWRMLVPYNIITTLGYPYFLQVDDDLMILQPIKVNMVEEMRKKNMTVATHRKPVEYWHVMYGLPELAKFYLTSHNLQAGGSLFKHLSPPDMTGLFSPTTNWWRKPNDPKEGYDLVILYGNFMGMSTALWKDEKVQDFITLCINSGGLERHRWQEQGVFTFVALLFTEPHQLWHLTRSQLVWLHTRRMEKLKPICGDLS